MSHRIKACSTTWVVGVDGCPGGWLVVRRPLDDPAAATKQVCRSFAEVLALQADVICVDMPIGLPVVKGQGGRIADVEARYELRGRRKASVFSVPSREAVMQLNYQDACDVALATSCPKRKVSKQAFNIFPKIREIDALMSPILQERVYETHPEVGFWALNGEISLDESKKSILGLERRRQLLGSAGYVPGFLTNTSQVPSRQFGKDDLLDAAVCSWTAARIAKCGSRRFPENPSLDARGLRMEIWG